jgi:hypothetical protein
MGKPEGRRLLGIPRGRIILKWIGFIWFRRGISAGLLLAQ